MSPQEYQVHQTTVEAQDQSYDNNTGKMFSALFMQNRMKDV